jgi:hypothetical protein
MTTDDDPFERAAVREDELRVQDDADDALVRQSALSSRQMAVFLAIALPVHLWLRGWAWSGWLTAHAVFLAMCASHAFNAWNDRRLGRRAPVYRIGRQNFIVYGWKKKERW